MHNKIIVSFGMPGSGKTTILKDISRAMPNYKYVYDDSISKKGTVLNDMINKIFVGGCVNLFFDFQMLSLKSRYNVYNGAKKPACVDETIFNTLVYTHTLHDLGYIKKKQYQIFIDKYNKMESEMIPPDAVIYTECSAQKITERILARSVRHEKYYTEQYLVQLKTSVIVVLDMIKEKYSLYKINTEHKKSTECAAEFIRDVL